MMSPQHCILTSQQTMQIKLDKVLLSCWNQYLVVSSQRRDLFLIQHLRKKQSINRFSGFVRVVKIILIILETFMLESVLMKICATVQLSHKSFRALMKESGKGDQNGLLQEFPNVDGRFRSFFGCCSRRHNSHT